MRTRRPSNSVNAIVVSPTVASTPSTRMLDDTGTVCRPVRRTIPREHPSVPVGGPVSAVLFGSLAALLNAAQAIISKGLTERAPARQLIGVLYAGNAVVLLPFAPFVAWSWSPTIVGLHLASVALMVFTAICVWDLLEYGAASATTTATAMSPIPAALAVAIVF